ncbi:two-component system response regulator [Thermotomaculum hydrothermale]|uniref:Two-component system response regulator n=1 Tax=Thermotomaculum hydrothermale TaxID=981385 RepID=A0A7R6PLV3_9BACT|nr:response regulator [Thermotomaculum hydrothermale]BBB32482.1 two-component system response regulator [Thermotomaculum hydrothermale]
MEKNKFVSGIALPFIPKAEEIKILAVDDEDEILDSLEEILVLNGFSNIDTASNGDEAIEKLKKKHYDIVITDISMPGKNGFEVVEFVTKNCFSTVAIVMTGYIDTDTAIKSFKSGAYDFLKKPFNKEMLLLALDRALAKRAVILADENYKKILEEEVERRTEKVRELNKKIIELYELSQNTKETLELDKAINIFKHHSVRFFKPMNFAILLYSPLNDTLTMHHEFYSQHNFQPERFIFNAKEFIITQSKQVKNAIFLFKNDNYSVLVKLIRHNHFLGFLYMGFAEEKEFKTLDEKLLELFVSELEASLYHC